MEKAVLTLPEIGQCAVVPVSAGGFEGTAIGCAFVAGQRGLRLPVDLEEAPHRASTQLHDPVPLAELEALPLNDRGKVDRRRLRQMMEAE